MLENDEKTDPRVLRTRHMLHQAMGDLLAEKSLSSITVQEIADRATVNRATFYAHYEDKFDLFTELARAAFSEQVGRHIPDEPGLTRRKLEALILALAEMQEQRGDHCSPADLQLRGIFETEVQSQVKEQILDWCQITGDDPDHALRATLLSWGIFGAVRDWVRQPKRQPPAEFAARLAAVLDRQRAGLVPAQATSS